jgi:S1-C subfamily serine protease
MKVTPGCTVRTAAHVRGKGAESMELRRPTRTRVSVLSLLLAALAAAPAPAADTETAEKVYQQTLKGTVWVLSPRGRGTASGTGSLIDKNRRLIITNYHVVGDSEEVLVVFPEYSKGKVVAEKNFYRNLVREGRAIHGKVLHRDLTRDLAVIEIERVPTSAQVIHLSQDGAGTAQTVHSIGNPGKSDALWEYTSGTVRSLHHKKWRVKDGDKILEFAAKVVETQSPTNPGDSGGPLVNKDGELVGITQGIAVDAQLISLFIDVSEVRDFLGKHKLLQKLPAGQVARGGKSKPGESSKADGENAEQLAAKKLELGKRLADEGKLESAKKWYERILADYPKTKAAEEAKTLLDQLKD